MKPGDLIEWTYREDSLIVLHDEVMWSTIEKRYVPIGSGMVHMLVDLDSRSYVWLNFHGSFRAHFCDVFTSLTRGAAGSVSPRTRSL